MAAAEYEVYLQLSSDSGSNGQVSIGESTLRFSIAQAVEKTQIASPDRFPRTEVYEYDWPLLNLGMVRLEPGDHQILLSVDESQNLEFKSLILRTPE